jgi:hypothetical protein
MRSGPTTWAHFASGLLARRALPTKTFRQSPATPASAPGVLKSRISFITPKGFGPPYPDLRPEPVSSLAIKDKRREHQRQPAARRLKPMKRVASLASFVRLTDDDDVSGAELQRRLGMFVAASAK